jgi:hypothetical protein
LAFEWRFLGLAHGWRSRIWRITEQAAANQMIVNTNSFIIAGGGYLSACTSHSFCRVKTEEGEVEKKLQVEGLCGDRKRIGLLNR